MIHDLVKAIQNAVAALIRALSIFAVGFETMFVNFLTNGIKGAIIAWTPILNALGGSLKPTLDSVISAFKTEGPQIAESIRAPVATLAKGIFATSSAALETLGESVPDTALTAAGDAMADAFGAGLSSFGVSAAFEALFPEKLNTLNGVGPMLSQMAGFEEVAKAVREPLYENAFGQALSYYYKSKFKPEFADEGDAVQWHSRRLLSEDDLREVFKYSGLKAKYEDAYVQSAYRAIQPRALVSLVQDTVFPTADMTELLKFAGIRDQDIARVLPLMEANSTKNLRNSYLAALLNAAERGALDTPTLDSDLDALNFSATAKNFAHLTVAVKRLVQLEELYRKSVSIGYKYGEITDAQYVPLLEAAGIGAADAQAHYDIDSEIVRGKALAAAERAAARLEEKAAALAIATTRTEFLKGNIDAIAMGAAVAVSGIPAALVPATVALITAQGAARKVNLYGLLLDPPAAQLLREKVAAVKEQVLKKVLTLDAARATLDSFNLPGANVQALLSEWAAQALKVVLPV